ncbi:50S ribosomal protein L24 [Pyrobaculum sp. 3827-6]|jgi:large subunit ribosomal protein L24|uniref:Large ribosomal subunit protein uL24 n=1 Tax=Pyrobaculum ferrireducens TaxID=1104324 RepID=G7VDE6_9CREN|nr:MULTISPECIES: 50S ribosomal protein L24 [Pyrobaculum]AET32731.1 50S ribosomal protein L24P [Pyrobaculum ferrireducens]MCU7787200.1 50S ribosomal protein L24 [Pyrobaculum sp. 3827-6]
MPFTTSAQPRKQRLSLYEAPPHLRRKLFNAKLSPELAKKLGVKRLPVRRGDTVLILRGDFKGVRGKVVRVDTKKIRIYVEGATRTNSKGQTVYYPIHPSKVMIVEVDTSDKARQKIIERRKK